MADRMREVELVESADERSPMPPGTPGEPPPGESDGGRGRSWARRHARWLVPAAVVAALALVATQVVVDARERTRLEALAAIPGIVPPTGPDLHVIWRADPALATVLQGGTQIDGLLVGGRSSGADGVDLVALNTDTGEVRWTTPVQLPTARVTPQGVQPSSWVGCVPVQHAERTLAACVSQRWGDDVVGIPDSGTWVIDPGDGTVLAHDVVPGGAGVAFTDNAFVVATRLAAGSDEPAHTDANKVRWRTTATDLVSGATLWTYTTPVIDTRGREDGPEGANASGAATLQAFGQQLILSVDLHAWILRDDGTVVRDVTLDPASWIDQLRNGVYLESTYTSAAANAGKLLFPDGSSARIDESASQLWVDDGSAPGMLFTVTGGVMGALGISGRDATNGKLLWHRDGQVSAVLLLRGVLYLATDRALQAVDATTGHLRWSTPIDLQAQQLSTDGRYLLVPGLHVSLDAYSLSNGRLAWSKDLLDDAAGDRNPVYVQGFQSAWHDPRLYVWMDDGAVAVLG